MFQNDDWGQWCTKIQKVQLDIFTWSYSAGAKREGELRGAIYSIVYSGVTSIKAGRALAPPGSKLKIRN